MEPIAVAALALREQLPEISLRPGATLLARVASRGERHAVIVLAGIPVTARVPPEVEAGATLKLRVHEVTPERVTLQLDAAPPPQAPPVPPPAARPAPARVAVDDPPARRRGADGEEVHSVALSFTSPALGRLGLRVELRGERVTASVEAPAGDAHARAQAGADKLRAALEARTGLRAGVEIRPRREPLDVYA